MYDIIISNHTLF